MQDQTYWDAWEAAIDDTLAKLVGDRAGGIFVSDSNNGRLQRNQEHLVCFLAGNVALGAQQTGQLDSSKVALYMKFAEQLAETCWQMYNISATGTVVVPCQKCAQTCRISLPCKCIKQGIAALARQDCYKVLPSSWPKHGGRGLTPWPLIVSALKGLMYSV